MSPEVQYIQVPAEQQERRLDNFLLSRLKGVPKSHIYAIIRSGEVRINSKRAKADTRLKAEDRIRIPPLRTAQRAAKSAGAELIQQVQDAVLFQDEHLIAINKPRGLGAHGGVNRPFGVIEVLHQLYANKDVYLAHRLDLETTGLLLIASNLHALRELNRVWHDPACRKIYLVLVRGCWPHKEKTITTHLSKVHQGGEYIMRSTDDPSSKEAITKFTLLKHLTAAELKHRAAATAPEEKTASALRSDQTGTNQTTQASRATRPAPPFSLLSAELMTGRTHQIRLQCAEAGCPVVGDGKYSFLAGEDKQQPASRVGSELALHSWQLQLPPLLNKDYSFTAPPPALFSPYLDSID